MAENRQPIKDEQHEIWEAVGGLRHDVSTLQTDLASVKTEVQLGNATNIRIENAVEGLRNQNLAQQQANKPPYNLMISAAAFILSFVAAIGTLAYVPLVAKDKDLQINNQQTEQRSKERQDEVRKEFHELIDLHIQTANAKREATNEKLRQLEGHINDVQSRFREDKTRNDEFHLMIVEALAKTTATLDKVSATQERFAGGQ